MPTNSNPKTYHVVRVVNKTDTKIFVMNFKLRPEHPHYFFVDPSALGRFMSIKQRVGGLRMKVVRQMISKNAIFNKDKIALIEPYNQQTMKHLLGYGGVKDEDVRKMQTPEQKMQDKLDAENDGIHALNPDAFDSDMDEEDGGESETNTAEEMGQVMSSDEGDDASDEIEDLESDLLSMTADEIKDKYGDDVNFRNSHKKSTLIKKVIDTFKD